MRRGGDRRAKAASRRRGALIALSLAVGACGAERASRAPGPSVARAPVAARAPDASPVVDGGAPGALAATRPLTLAVAPPRWVLPDGPSRAAKTQELARRIEHLLDEEHDRGRTGASFSFALVVDGAVALVKARGVADLDGKVVATPDTIYRVASITKTFTTAAVLSLRDAGKLRTDDPVALHLGELGDAPYPTGDAAPVTIAQILTHAAGLVRSGAYAAEDRPSTEADLAGAMRAPLDLDPGVAYRYSNLGFGLLGLLVARKTATPYRAWVTSHLLAPLGMHASGFDASALPSAKLAVGYVRDASGKLKARPMTQNGVGEGAGGLFSSAPDMARWIAFQLGAWPPRSDDDRGPVRRSTLREAQMPRNVHSVTTSEGKVDGVWVRRLEARSVGLGWHVTTGCYFDRLVGHDGDLDGFHARVRFDPTRGIGFVLLTSSDTAEATPIMERVLDTIALYDGLAPFERAPSEALARAVDAAITGMRGAWTEDEHRAALAESLRAVLSAAEVRRLAALRNKAVGACHFARAIGSSGALDGSFEYACQRGKLRVSARGAGDPVLLQNLSIASVTPPTDDDKKIARAVATSMIRAAPAELASALGVRDAKATAARLRASGYLSGACRVGDGETVGDTTTFTLTCAKRRGTLQLHRRPGGQVHPSLDLHPRCVR